MSTELVSFFLFLIFMNFIVYLKFYKIANFINIYDKPDKILKKHKFSVPLLGGFILLVNCFLVLIFVFFFYDQNLIINFSERALLSIIFFLLSFFLLGVMDDKYGIRPEKKIILSVVFSIIAITLNKDLLISDLNFSFYSKTLYLNDFEYFFTIFCVIILINSLNFYDGINGQSIIFLIICFIYLAFKSPNYLIYISIIFVLVFNLVLNLQNKLFMGDSGIYLSSIILTVSLIYEYNVVGSIIYADEIFLLLIIPGYDLLRLSIQRILKGKSAFYGDRNHIHHLLMKKFNLFRTNIILFFLSVLPILLFTVFKINFFNIFFITTTIYLILILILQIDDKKYHIRQKK